MNRAHTKRGRKKHHDDGVVSGLRRTTSNIKHTTCLCEDTFVKSKDEQMPKTKINEKKQICNYIYIDIMSFGVNPMQGITFYQLFTFLCQFLFL